MSIHSFIHSFILETYIAPLQETTTQRRSQPSHGQYLSWLELVFTRQRRHHYSIHYSIHCINIVKWRILTKHIVLYSVFVNCVYSFQTRTDYDKVSQSFVSLNRHRGWEELAYRWSRSAASIYFETLEVIKSVKYFQANFQNISIFRGNFRNISEKFLFSHLLKKSSFLNTNIKNYRWHLHVHFGLIFSWKFTAF